MQDFFHAISKYIDINNFTMGKCLQSIQGVKMGDVLVVTDRYMLVIRMAIL